MGIKEIKTVDGQLLALIVSWWFKQPGTWFATSADQPLQLGFLNRSKGEIIEAHTHREIPREVLRTQEILVIRKGRLLLSIFAEDRRLVVTEQLEAGDVVMLVSGGHSIEFLDDTEIVECKQGPHHWEDKISYGQQKQGAARHQG